MIIAHYNVTTTRMYNVEAMFEEVKHEVKPNVDIQKELEKDIEEI